MLRQGDNFWLLDFDIARGYADLLARKAANAAAPSAPALSALANSPVAGETLPSSPASAVTSAPDQPQPPATFMEDPGTAIPAALALRAEWFADNQAWCYASALLEAAHGIQQYDYRAPRVNPLLQARCLLLSGQRLKARATCREALGLLVADTTDYNRMIRFHLQGLLFAKP